MTEPSETEKPQTEEDRAAAAEADAKAARDRAEKRAARTARLAELKVQLEAWEDKCLTLWHTLEVRKLDLVINGGSPRGIFLRDEAKKHLNEYTELKKMHLAGMREYAMLEEEEFAERNADDKTLRTWGPAIGGFLGGALMGAIGKAASKVKAGVVSPVSPAADTIAPPTEPSGGVDENPGGENPSTPLGDKQNAP